MLQYIKSCNKCVAHLDKDILGEFCNLRSDSLGEIFITLLSTEWKLMESTWKTKCKDRRREKITKIRICTIEGGINKNNKNLSTDLKAGLWKK